MSLFQLLRRDPGGSDLPSFRALSLSRRHPRFEICLLLPCPSRASQPSSRSVTPAARAGRGPDRLQTDCGEALESAEGKQTVADLVVQALLRKAQRGNLAAIKEVIVRMEGREPVKIEAEVSATHYEADIPEILASLGYSGPGITAETGTGQPGGTGSGCIAGEIDQSAAFEIAGSGAAEISRKRSG